MIVRRVSASGMKIELIFDSSRCDLVLMESSDQDQIVESIEIERIHDGSQWRLGEGSDSLYKRTSQAKEGTDGRTRGDMRPGKEGIV